MPFEPAAPKEMSGVIHNHSLGITLLGFQPSVRIPSGTISEQRYCGCSNGLFAIVADCCVASDFASRSRRSFSRLASTSFCFRSASTLIHLSPSRLAALEQGVSEYSMPPVLDEHLYSSAIAVEGEIQQRVASTIVNNKEVFMVVGPNSHLTNPPIRVLTDSKSKQAFDSLRVAFKRSSACAMVV